MQRRKVVILVAVASACAALGTYAWKVLEPESSRHARSTATEVLVLTNDRVLLRNGLGQVFESDSGGEAWREATSGVFNLAVTDSSQVWGCHGSPGVHEGPSATVWHSPDAGRSWSRTNLSLPAGSGHSSEVLRRLPVAFINEPADPPLLLMRDLQLVRPRAGADFDAWSTVGTRVPAESWSGRWRGGGIQHGHVIYVGTPGRVFMSVDNARTWVGQTVRQFFDAQFTCGDQNCYALLSELGSAWSGIATTPVGQNDWKPFGTLDLESIKQALTQQSAVRGAIVTFGATSILRGHPDILVSGIVNAGGNAWGAVLVASAYGPLRSLPGSVPEGLWGLARDARGRLWTAGIGAFIHDGSRWTEVWSGKSTK